MSNFKDNSGLDTIKPKMSKEERDKLMKDFLDKGGKIQKLKPGYPTSVGSLDKIRNLPIQKMILKKVYQVRHLNQIIIHINKVHTTTMMWVVINHLCGNDNQKMRWEVNNIEYNR